MRALCTFLICACLGVLRLVAQVSTASLTGEVTDITRALVPGTNVELQSVQASAKSYGTKTDGYGIYRFLGLPADEYTLKLVQKGFTPLTVKSIHLSAGEQRWMPPLELEVAINGHCSGHALDYLRFLPAGGRVGNLGGSVWLDQGLIVSTGPVLVTPQAGQDALAGFDISLICGGGIVCGVTKTDSRGEFMFKNLSPGIFSVRVSRAGFYPLEEPGYKVKEGLDLIYYSIPIERCPLGDCDPALRPKKEIVICE